MKREQIHHRAYEILAITAVCLLPFSKWLSSVSVILLLVNWVLEGKFSDKLPALRSNFPALLMIGFFIYSASGMFFTTNPGLCAFALQKKLALPVIGLTLGSVAIYGPGQVRNFFRWFTATILLASIFC